MNAPPAFVLLFGNWLGFLTALAVGGIHVVFWYENQATVPWWVLALGLFVIAQALRVRWRYTQYRDWQRAANELSGAADMRRAAAPARRRQLLVFGSVALWCGCVWWVGEYGSRGEYSDVAAALWMGVSVAWLALGLRSIARWVGRRRRVAKLERARDHVVTIALPVPRDAPGQAEAQAGLPDYCKALLAHDPKRV